MQSWPKNAAKLVWLEGWPDRCVGVRALDFRFRVMISRELPIVRDTFLFSFSHHLPVLAEAFFPFRPGTGEREDGG
jgi:hypothetical protein